MATEKDQQKAGRPEKPRGQEMGRGGDRDQNRKAKKATPALRGGRKGASKMFEDNSSQHVGSDAATPRTNQPSVPGAVPTGRSIGESGGESEFKSRQKKRK